MFESPHCRRAIGVVTMTLVVAQGCFVYRPAPLPVPAGSTVRVQGANLEIYDGSIGHPTAKACQATQLGGRLFQARGDTLTIAPVQAMSGSEPRRACSRLKAATLVAAPDSTQIFVLHFSPARTTGLVVGTVPAVAGVLVIDYLIYMSSSHDPNMGSYASGTSPRGPEVSVRLR